MWYSKAAIVLVVIACVQCSDEDSDELGPNWVLEGSCMLPKLIQGLCVRRSQCKRSTVTTEPPSTVTTTEPTILQPRSMDNGPGSGNENNGCKKYEICCHIDNLIQNEPSREPIARGCGYSNPGGIMFRRPEDPKLTKALYSEFPWMVALMEKKNSPQKTFADEYIGGGTIIHPSVVLTLAHKVDRLKSNMLKCRAGEWNWIMESEIYKYQEQDVSSIIIHNDYNKGQFYYDVALLYLTSPYEMTPNIQVACLEPTMPPKTTTCYGMGWGKDFSKDVNNVETLKKVTLPLLSRVDCQQLFTKYRKRNYVLHESFVCAGGEKGIDTCTGDGGSSLVYRIDEPQHVRYAVVGIVAAGVKCGLAEVPGVYTSIPHIYNWVDNQMTNLRLDPTTYKYNK